MYPHREINGNMVAIPLEEIPQARAYLESYLDVLKKRSYLVESKGRISSKIKTVNWPKGNYDRKTKNRWIEFQENYY